MADLAALSLLLGCFRGELPEHEGDWKRVIALANDTLTTGTLAQRLLAPAIAPRLPPELRRFLDTIAARVEGRNRRMDAQLVEAVCALHRAGLRPVLIKGVALRLLKRTEASGRILSDIDLVLPMADRAKALRALGQFGYEQLGTSDDPSRPAVLARSEDVGMIDLQFAFRASGMGYDHADLLHTSTRVQLDDGFAYLPDATMQAALLVIHDQIKDQDYWRGLIDLRHLLDMEILSDEIDWRALSRQFTAEFAQAALRTQLATLHRLLNVAIPAEILAGAWPALQHRRRMAQIRWPWTRAIFAYLTIMADIAAGRLQWRGLRLPGRRKAGRWQPLSPRTGGNDHLLRQKATGKV